MKKKTAYLIYNPTSGPIWNSFKPSIVENYLKDKNWDLTVLATEYQGHASELAKKAVEDNIYMVIAAGGDGTINEVVQGLAGGKTVLAILPVGTTNVMARDLKIPLSLQDAIQVIDNGEEGIIDLGIINDRYFVLMAGIGFDGKIISDTNSGLKKITGMGAFVATIPVLLVGYKTAGMSVTLWDKNGKKKKIKRSSYQALVSNSSTYAISLKVALDANPNDGLLDLDIFKTSKLHKFAWQLVSIAFLTKKSNKEDVENFQFAKAMIKAEPPMPIQVDGDTYGYTPALIEVKPDFLRIMKPKSS